MKANIPVQKGEVIEINITIIVFKMKVLIKIYRSLLDLTLYIKNIIYIVENLWIYLI